LSPFLDHSVRRRLRSPASSARPRPWVRDFSSVTEPERELASLSKIGRGRAPPASRIKTPGDRNSARLIMRSLVFRKPAGKAGTQLQSIFGMLINPSMGVERWFARWQPNPAFLKNLCWLKRLAAVATIRIEPGRAAGRALAPPRRKRPDFARDRRNGAITTSRAVHWRSRGLGGGFKKKGVKRGCSPTSWPVPPHCDQAYQGWRRHKRLRSQKLEKAHRHCGPE